MRPLLRCSNLLAQLRWNWLLVNRPEALSLQGGMITQLLKKPLHQKRTLDACQ